MSRKTNRAKVNDSPVKRAPRAESGPQDHAALLEHAARVRERAYAPYSRYPVGAAVLGKSGKIYAGCNVENASYGLTICAERNAIFKGISEGETEFVAMAVVLSNGGSPCGACRQVAYEFMPAAAPVILADPQLNNIRVFSLDALLPDGFSPKKLRQGQQTAEKKSFEKNPKTTK